FDICGTQNNGATNIPTDADFRVYSIAIQTVAPIEIKVRAERQVYAFEWLAVDVNPCETLSLMECFFRKRKIEENILRFGLSVQNTAASDDIETCHRDIDSRFAKVTVFGPMFGEGNIRFDKVNANSLVCPDGHELNGRCYVEAASESVM